MNTQGTFITWEQAVKMDVLQPIGEKYLEMIREIINYFATNTAAQLLYIDLYCEAIELFSTLNNKDYSKYLFDKVEVVMTEFEKVKPDLDGLKTSFQKAATLVTEVMLKSEDKL